MQGLVGSKKLWLARGLSFRGTVLALALLVLGGALALSTPLVAQSLFNSLQVYPPRAPSDLTATTSEPPTAIVIVAAGRRRKAIEFGGEFDSETLDSLSLERVRYGAYVARKTGLPILVTGGLGSSNEYPLANLMAETLWSDYGIRAKWLETRSANTAENAIYSAEMLKRAGVTRVLLVTHAWHMKRANAAFVANGIVVTPATTALYIARQDELFSNITPSVATFRMSAYALHEIIGSLWYSLRYGY